MSTLAHDVVGPTLCKNLRCCITLAGSGANEMHRTAPVNRMVSAFRQYKDKHLAEISDLKQALQLQSEKLQRQRDELEKQRPAEKPRDAQVERVWSAQQGKGKGKGMSQVRPRQSRVC